MSDFIPEFMKNPYNGYLQRAVQVMALRRVFPVEWGMVMFYSPIEPKKSVETMWFALIEGAEIRLDFEYSQELLAQCNDWVDFMKIARKQMYSDLGDLDLIERARKKVK